MESPFTMIGAYVGAETAAALETSMFRYEWANFLLRYLDQKNDVGEFAREFEKTYGRAAKTKGEFSLFCGVRSYNGVEMEDVAEMAFRFGMEQEEFDECQSFFESFPPKERSFLPDVTVEDGEYVFRKLADDDKRCPLLGFYTGCCQHILDGFGAPVAISGWTSENCAFYVVEKNGDITVGYTNSGISIDVMNFLGKEQCDPIKPLENYMHSDAKYQWLLCARGKD